MAKRVGKALVLRPDGALLEKNPHLRSLASQLSIAYVQKYKVDDGMLEQVGRAFWAALQAEVAMVEAKKNAGLGVLPVALESLDPEILALPWETIWSDGSQFLARGESFAFSRQVAGAMGDNNGSPPKGPVRASVVYLSLPDDVDAEDSRLDVESEQENLLEAFHPAVRQGTVDLTVPRRRNVLPIQATGWRDRSPPHYLERTR